MEWTKFSWKVSLNIKHCLILLFLFFKGVAKINQSIILPSYKGVEQGIKKACIFGVTVALLTQKCSVSADTILSGRSCQSFMVAGKKDNCPQCSTGYGQAVWNALSSV